MSERQLLQNRWNALYRETLPSLAKQKHPSQQEWPVVLDHCFARIILDNTVGVTRPWTDVVKAPAVKHMTESQLEAALKLGADIREGKQDLKRLDDRSLELRGKLRGAGYKRKSERGAVVTTAYQSSDQEAQSDRPKKSRKGQMADLWAKYSAKDGTAGDPQVQDVRNIRTFTLPTPPTSAKSLESDNSRDEITTILERIASDNSLTPFRKRVLSMLTQVPRGRYTTYKALSESVSKTPLAATSNARAIGSAMRNNPFAPAVPCHRVLAANGKIGGFCGDWGEEGRFVGEKRRLLREEGVKFDGRGTVVGAPFTDFV